MHGITTTIVDVQLIPLQPLFLLNAVQPFTIHKYISVLPFLHLLSPTRDVFRSYASACLIGAENWHRASNRESTYDTATRQTAYDGPLRDHLKVAPSESRSGPPDYSARADVINVRRRVQKSAGTWFVIKKEIVKLMLPLLILACEKPPHICRPTRRPRSFM